jgi:hypothetical protein
MFIGAAGGWNHLRMFLKPQWLVDIRAMVDAMVFCGMAQRFRTLSCFKVYCGIIRYLKDLMFSTFSSEKGRS